MNRPLNLIFFIPVVMLLSALADLPVIAFRDLIAACFSGCGDVPIRLAHIVQSADIPTGSVVH